MRRSLLLAINALVVAAVLVLITGEWWLALMAVAVGSIGGELVVRYRRSLAR